MFVTQQFIPRWKKEWLPLATQQLRLRNLIRILAFKINNDKTKSLNSNLNEVTNKFKFVDESYYFTLHATTMSAPFYTSEKLKSESPRWKELELSSWEGDTCSSIDAVVIRLWFSSPVESEDKVLAVWGVCLSGLMYLGPTLKGDIPLKPNSIIFLMPGGYFTDPKCLNSNIKIRYVSWAVKKCDIRSSYSLASLKRLQTLQLVIKKEVAEAELLKKKISKRDFFRSESRGKTALRKLLSKHKPKTNYTDLIKVKENIEIIKYRVNILKEEKAILLQKINDLNKHTEFLIDSNHILNSKIMENYRALKKEIFSHREWKKSYIDRREKYLHSKAMLNFRTKQLISELNLIYPIVEVSTEKFTICDIHLPNSEDFAGHDDLQISIALGFVTHIIQMISVFLQIPLRYPVVHFGSRSKIIDQITDKIPDSEREFCLYVKGKEKLQFHYAVYLLNKNIAQIRWLCGLPTSDLRNTLENLSSLVKMKIGNSTLEQGSQSLSSSTIDICSSNVSVSSPLGSVPSYQSKKLIKSHIMVDFGIDSNTKSSNMTSLHVPGHQVSKSIGSSKDLLTNVTVLRNKTLLENKKRASNNLSCSLDKGLNEFKDITSSKKKETDQYGSEPTLNHSDNISKYVQSGATDKFLNSWKSESQKVPFSDDDSEINMTDLSHTKLQSVHQTFQEEQKEYNSFSDIKSDSDSAIEATEMILEGETHNIEKPSSAEILSVNEGAIECTSFRNQKIGDTIGQINTGDTTQCDTGNTNFMDDRLLESVTNRTEALVNQSTCFNRFRTRFKSTLESSN